MGVTSGDRAWGVKYVVMEGNETLVVSTQEYTKCNSVYLKFIQCYLNTCYLKTKTPRDRWTGGETLSLGQHRLVPSRGSGLRDQVPLPKGRTTQWCLRDRRTFQPGDTHAERACGLEITCIHVGSRLSQMHTLTQDANSVESGRRKGELMWELELCSGFL